VVLVLAAGLVGALAGGFKDLSVYLYGGQGVLDGHAVLGSRDPVSGLPFTYPPFAAVAIVPLAVLPRWLASALWTAGSLAALAGVVAFVRREAGRPAPGWLVALLTCGSLALEPVWQNLSFGQVNLVLMLVILLDVAGRERRWSGLLVGVAAGVKLTPLVFVVLLLAVGRRRAAVRATVAFAATVAVGFAGMPRDSLAYWGHRLLDASRVGPPSLAHNQSVYGALTRLLHGPPPTVLWLAVAGPIAVAVLALAVRWWRLGDRVLGTCVGALAMLVASPISWSHHWVWAVPIALALWERSRPVALAWTAVFVTRPFVWLPWGHRREYGWTPLEHVVGNAYLLSALALCAYLAGLAYRSGGAGSLAPGAHLRGPGGQAAGGPGGRPQLARDRAGRGAQRRHDDGVERPVLARDHQGDRAHGTAQPVTEDGGDAALAEHCLVDLLGDAGEADLGELRPDAVWVGERLAGHAPQRLGVEHVLGGLVVERQDRLAQGAGVGRDDDAHLGHLSRAVGTGLVVDHHDVVDEQDGRAHRETGPPGEVLGPRHDPRAKLEGVEVHVAEGEDRGAEAVLRRVVLLDDHPVAQQGAQDAVDGGRGQVEPLRDVPEAEPVVALEHGEDPQSAVDRLDHVGSLLMRPVENGNSSRRTLVSGDTRA
jgi:alpha-1,2-mannosyltransferase